jgi:hypothetical protein
MFNISFRNLDFMGAEAVALGMVGYSLLTSHPNMLFKYNINWVILPKFMCFLRLCILRQFISTLIRGYVFSGPKNGYGDQTASFLTQ